MENNNENISDEKVSENAEQEEQTTPLVVPQKFYGVEFYNRIQIEKAERHKRIMDASKGSNKILLIICLLAVSLFIANTFYDVGISGILMPVSVSFLYIIFYTWKGFRKEFFNKDSVTMLVLILVLSAGFVLNGDSLTILVTFLTLAVAIPIQLRVSTQHDSIDDLSIIPRTVKTVFQETFSVVPSIVPSIKNNENKKQSTVKYVLIGLLCTIPFVIVLTILFASGDDMFRQSIDRIYWCFTGVNIIRIGFTIVAGIILCIYLTALFLRLKSDEKIDLIQRKNSRKLNATAVTSFLAVLIALELFFSFIQVKYLFLNMGTLAEGETFADYARNGFFEISAATIITIAIIFFVSIFVKRNENDEIPLTIKIMLTVFSVCVCLMFASSYYRMIVYINKYSLTVKRVAVCWLMALMLIILIGVLINIWSKKFKLMKYVVLSVLVAVAALNVLQIDSFVAKNNVDRYLEDPSGFTIDIYYLAELEPASTPQLIRLYNTEEFEKGRPIVYGRVCDELYSLYCNNSDYHPLRDNIPTYRSRKMINDLFFDENNRFEGIKGYGIYESSTNAQKNNETVTEYGYNTVHNAYEALPIE